MAQDASFKSGSIVNDSRCLAALMISAVDSIIIIDSCGIIQGMNPAAEKLFGYSMEEIIGQNISKLMPSPHRENHDGYLARYLQGGDTQIVGVIREIEGLKKDGSPVPLELSVSEFKIDDTIYFAGILHDITNRKKTELELLHAHEGLEKRVQERTQALQQTTIQLQKEIQERTEAVNELKLAAKVFENASEAILITDANTTIIEVNNAYLQITGYEREEIIGANPRILKSGQHEKAFYQKLWSHVEKFDEWTGEIWDRRKNGQAFPSRLTINAVRDNDDNLTNYVGIFSDISEIKAGEQRLEKLAYYDPLTHLPNRLLFKERLVHEINKADRSKIRLAVMFIDLDRFKNVNDTLGHAAGDKLLIIVGKRILSCLRRSDTVARLGGDEFTVILNGIDREEDIAHIAESIINALQRPAILSGQEVFIGASIGIGLFPTDGEDFDTLTKNADIAMYQSKKAGRGVFRFFKEEMNAWTTHQLQLESNLQRALERDEFRVVYQPKICIVSHQVVGMEALIRWQHPEHGLVSPGEFIPLAEETGLIGPMSDWVMKTAFAQTHKWNQTLETPLSVAVNLSARQFQSANLIETIQDHLNTSGLLPHLAEIELTESMMIADLDAAIETLTNIRKMGVKLAMDDFGTGYSSLNFLKKLPITTLKIDQSFIRDLKFNSPDETIVAAIIAMATSLKLDVVAEGVEKLEQLNFLSQHGCPTIQGYYFSPPLGPDKFIEEVQRRLER
ncbi:MAG: EAL domain-containing protein [Magnetococcales bacterium]|nr:EAL domain-containing protein [Magnetococcales bacterium]